jgi:hypothetical protein
MGDTYTGRLAFDPETGFHTDPDGAPVVTVDEGKSWRYAVDSDTPHNDRYQERIAVVDSTANQLAELQLEHGRDKAAELVEPHHFEVQPDDEHFGGVRFDPDTKAETITGHTEAYQ